MMDDTGTTNDAPSATGSDGSSMMGTGQFSATLNATMPYHLGAEHLGSTAFGTVIDTSPGANRARVGWIQSTKIVPGQQVKWVWPKILVAGHTYEMAMFCDDQSKNRTCAVTAGKANSGWLFKIPAVSADYQFDWKTPVVRVEPAECPDFPMGPIMGEMVVPAP
jgi:hypothetical protein